MAAGLQCTIPPRFHCSYRIGTIVLCCFNILAAIFLFQSVIGPLLSTPSISPSSAVLTSSPPPWTGVQYTPEQVDRMKEAITIWRAAEPVDLIKRVKEIQEESTRVYRLKDTSFEKKPRSVGLAERLKELHDPKSRSDQALEEWRRKKSKKQKDAQRL